jgi:hypothetical protein
VRIGCLAVSRVEGGSRNSSADLDVGTRNFVMAAHFGNAIHFL